ncbi:MAG: c-type cytochrome, partial [Mucilaginibacter polytrichastri]|nr:c-type cytochrome [Mucilaginibacter polytrichastri]
QYLHHDVWDRDLSSPPVLITMKKDGQKKNAVALTTKTGFLYFFERDTGKPVYKIEERPVPHTSELDGEKLSATQPQPTFPAPFMRQIFREQDINPYLPDSSVADIRKRLLSYKNDNMYNPLSFQGTVVFPGLDGGAEWGGPTFDPETGILYINANEMPWALKAVDIRSKANSHETFSQAGLRLYQATCMSCHGPERKGSGNFPSIADVKKKYSDVEINRLIQTGRRMMPAFKQLSDEQREAIVSFVTENASSGAKPFSEKSAKQNEHFRLPYTVKGYDKFLSKEGYPAIAPPWGTLNAYDVNAGKYLWKIPLGNDSTVKNSPSQTGMENYGASVATAGGVLFIAASKDGRFRAFNKRTGKLLREYKLPVPGFATPAIYSSGKRQFVVIACGGGKQGIKSGDSYLAFALPE